MNHLHGTIAKLCAVSEPSVVTVTLDVAKSGSLPPATRVFVKDEVLPRVPDGKLAAKLRKFIDGKLRPETNGAYVAAGASTWEAVELMVPLRNFVHVGHAPYVAPLAEAAARWPRAHVVEVDVRGALIHELDLGVWTDLDRIEAREEPRKAGKRDRYAGQAEKATDALLRDAGKRVAALAGKGGVVLVAGDKECHPALREYAPSAAFIGTRDRAMRELERMAEERLSRELLEFHERRAQGHLVALGPRDVLERMASGHIARAYVCADEPVPGAKCAGCGYRSLEAGPSCEYCQADLVPASMTQEVIAHAVTHPPLPITFVPAKERWLKDLGGMAALVAERGVRTKK